jgi:hypothetical protein
MCVIFMSNYFFIEDDISVDSETLLVIDFINFKINLTVTDFMNFKINPA